MIHQPIEVLERSVVCTGIRFFGRHAHRPTAGSGPGDSLPAVGRRCRLVARRRCWSRLVGANLACRLLHRSDLGRDAQLAGDEIGCLVGHPVVLV
jgi:hypothetical protein